MTNPASANLIEIAAEQLDAGSWLLIQLTKPNDDPPPPERAVAHVETLIRAAMSMERKNQLVQLQNVLAFEGAAGLQRRMRRWRRGDDHDPLDTKGI